ncbi:MAG: hypothetical protein LBC42_03725 [Puniceicoccales bacterium]|jgi:hypothetical protein|nr:hypothetical protein [Puniceicoccales bacterium]
MNVQNRPGSVYSDHDPNAKPQKDVTQKELDAIYISRIITALTPVSFWDSSSDGEYFEVSRPDIAKSEADGT